MRYLLLALIFAGCQPYRYVTQKADIVISKNRAHVIKVGKPTTLPKDTIINVFLIYKKPVNKW